MRHTVTALRVVLVMVLAGSLFLQSVMVPVIALDMDGAGAVQRIAVVAILLLGILAVQVVAVSVWRLLTMVQRETVVSGAGVRHLEVVVGAIAVDSLLVFGLGVAAAPGEDVAPEMVLLLGGAATLVAGVALMVLVLRMLLADAVARDGAPDPAAR